jgi:uncharacterized protein (UPF0332 family)
MSSVTLAVVTSQKEQKELEELKRKITEYIIAMRIELERKRLVSAVSIYPYSMFLGVHRQRQDD